MNGREVLSLWDKTTGMPYHPYLPFPDSFTLERFTTDEKLARSKQPLYLACDADDGKRYFGIPAYFFRLIFLTFYDVPMTYLRWIKPSRFLGE